MRHDDRLRPAPHDQAPTDPGHRTAPPAAPRRHAAPRPAGRSGNHRADTGQPRTRAALLTGAAVLAVSGTCLVLIRPGSGADQALAADPAAPVRTTAGTSVLPESGGDAHSPRRHKPSPSPSPSVQETAGDGERSATPRATPTPAAPRPTPRTASHPPRVASGAGGGAGAPVGARTATGTAAEFAHKVVELVNAQRAQHGCAPLTADPHLTAAAQGHSDDMAARNYYAHETPEGVDPGTRMTRAGFPWMSWGENIFKSPKDPATAVDGWMNSPGHRANILNCAYKATGVGVNLSSNGPWWTQDFATHS
ncbi:CAP domain-containing protein [Streptomyces noursei]|uniref:CAP domain-containing protein n=1 Tax=Streptomyces noursei TaxID=1971 RepID=UPI0023B78EDF|nr:CAP domain-containing protein [Streptomyces noursei]